MADKRETNHAECNGVCFRNVTRIKDTDGSERKEAQIKWIADVILFSTFVKETFYSNNCFMTDTLNIYKYNSGL